MATGDILSATILAEGWRLRLVIEGFTTGATYSLGDGDLGTTTINLAVLSEGYTGSVLGTVSRSVYVTKVVKKVYPNDTVNEETGGGNLTVDLALNTRVFADDNTGAGKSGTAPTLSVAAGAIVNSGGAGQSSNAVSGFAVTNNSTAAYDPVVVHWAVPQRQAVNGTTTIEFLPMHGYARNQKPIAAAVVTAVGATSGTTKTATITAFTRSTSDSLPVFACDLDLSIAGGFTRGEAVNINVSCYPWVGDASAVTTSSGTSAKNFSTLVYTIMDRAVCVVDPSTGNDTTAYAGPNQTSANAAPALTIQGAVAKIKAYNNSTYSLNRADGGEVQLKAGNYLHGIGGGNAADTVNGWVTITRHSSATAAQVIYTGPNGTSRYAWNHQRIKDVTVTLSADYMMFQNTEKVCVFDSVNFTTTFFLSGGDGTLEFINCNSVGGAYYPGVSTTDCRLCRNSWITGATGGQQEFKSVRFIFGGGCRNCTSDVWVQRAGESVIPIIAYMRNLNHSGSLFALQADINGAALVSVLHEYVGSSNALCDFGNSSATNFMVFNVTCAGDRCNWQAGWPASVNNTLRMYVRGASLKWFAWKGDEYAPGYPTLTASWPVKYGVDFIQVNSEQDYAGTGSDEFPPQFAGVGSTRVVQAKYVDDRSRYGARPRGHGDYRLRADSSLRGRIKPADMAIAFDLDGNAWDLNSKAPLGAMWGPMAAPTGGGAYVIGG